MKKSLTPLTTLEHIIGWPYLVIQLIFLPSAIFLIDLLLNLQLGLTILNVTHFFISFVLTVLIFHRFLFAELKLALKRIWKVLLFGLLGFLLYLALNMLVSNLVYLLQPQHVNANNDAIGQMASQEYLLMFIGTVFLVPVTEEALFRGLIFNTLYRKNAVLGCILSSVLFSAIHVVGYIGTQDAYSLLISFLQYLPAGLALSLSYTWSGTIWTPILIHCTVNLIAMIAMR